MRTAVPSGIIPKSARVAAFIVIAAAIRITVVHSARETMLYPMLHRDDDNIESMKRAVLRIIVLCLPVLCFPGWAAPFPAPVEADAVFKDVKFASGETLGELKLH